MRNASWIGLFRAGAFWIIRFTVRFRFGRVTQIAPKDLLAWMQDGNRPGPVLLDVRHREEYETSHLTEAKHVDPRVCVEVIRQIADKTTPIVCYCSAGYRSSKLANDLMVEGWQKVFNLEGSIFAWANLGFPLEKNRRPTQEVHPYHTFFGWLIAPPDKEAKQDSVDRG